MKQILLTLLKFSLAIVLGFFCIVGPAYFSKGIDGLYPAPVFPLVRTAIERLQFYPTAICLFISGLILGFTFPKLWLYLAISTMVSFPVISVIEIHVDPASHNLMTIEFMVYLFLCLPAIIGSFLGKSISEKFKKGA